MNKNRSEFNKEFDSRRGYQGYTVEKVATLSAMSYSCLRSRLKNPKEFTVDELMRVSKVIAGDFGIMAQLIFDGR